MDKDIYETVKLLYCIMFNNFDNDYKNKPYMFDLAFIEMLEGLVENYVERGYLSDNVKNNINIFLSDAREYDDEYKKERIDIINNTIRIMNSQKQDNSIEFYRMQLALRRNDKKYINKYPDYIIKHQMSAVDLSICHDYTVIYSHSSEVSDEVFANEFLSYFPTSPIYYESLNAILDEYPSMFKDLTFYNRMICVLNLYNETYNNVELEKVNKRLVKRINKEVKKINKLDNKNKKEKDM